MKTIWMIYWFLNRINFDIFFLIRFLLVQQCVRAKWLIRVFAYSDTIFFKTINLWFFTMLWFSKPTNTVSPSFLFTVLNSLEMMFFWPREDLFVKTFFMTQSVRQTTFFRSKHGFISLPLLFTSIKLHETVFWPNQYVVFLEILASAI